MSQSPHTTRLIVVHRLEPGCLGPEGENLIDGFCSHANAGFRGFAGGIAHFLILPRRDKSQPEISYRILDKQLPREKAAIALDRLGHEIDAFEESIVDQVAELIETYFGRSGG